MRTGTRLLLMVLATCALLEAAYFSVRFAGRWLDADAARLTNASLGVFSEGKVAPSSGAYPYGFAYPAMNTLLARLGGASIEVLQRLVQPYLVVLLVPIAFVAFRALTDRPGVALLAALLLFLQPEFMFEALRSSHAKVTYALALGALYVLARSLAAITTASFVRWVILFYLLACGLIASNSFFASSYVFGIAFAFLGSLALQGWRVEPGGARASRLRRLLYTALSCSLLLFLFVFYLYPPAMQQVFFWRSSMERIASFVLDVEEASSPYAYVGSTWPSTGAYILLTLFNWLVLLLSFAVWCAQAWRFARRAGQPALLPPFLWLVYTAFAALLAFSVLVDLAGVLSANMQVRIFPHLMIVAVPVSAIGVEWAVRWLGPSSRARWAAAVALALCVLFFAAASLVKVTNDPLLSNNWGFHSSAEQASVRWIRGHVRYKNVQIAMDDRVRSLTEIYGDWSKLRLRSLWLTANSYARYYLISDISEAWRLRVGLALPDVEAQQRVYDSGQARLYYTRPKTPYQR